MATPVLKFEDNTALDLISSPVTLTGSWQTIGLPVVTKDYDLFSLWLDVDINLSLDVRVRAVAYTDISLTPAYELPIQEVTATKVSVSNHYIELANDVDQKIVLPLSISDLTPFVHIQVMAGTPGLTPGQILSAKLSAKTTGLG